MPVWVPPIANTSSLLLSCSSLCLFSSHFPSTTSLINCILPQYRLLIRYAARHTQVYHRRNAVPLTGWLAEAFGRKPLMLACIVFFGVGSGIAGAAESGISATRAVPSSWCWDPSATNEPGCAFRDWPSRGETIRRKLAIKGVGGGGVPLVAELIIRDMVPLPERPKMLGIVMATSYLGLVLGRVIGGVVVGYTTWKWIFWINCPLAVASALCLFPILGRRTQQQRDAATNLAAIARRFDWVGNFLLPASTISILLPLTMGGKMYDWSSFRVILPRALGAHRNELCATQARQNPQGCGESGAPSLEDHPNPDSSQGVRHPAGPGRPGTDPPPQCRADTQASADDAR
ncbi:uncharacterized protein TRIVIDRAFT_222581 [Trichoderma virens Gv29-8]|uniref:Major facilitator superfamily (MFS) profile domain-containing protein n=1 Tax=Hypocrea virens (strain Gv29-8 / FGSC 10586) TaxID=413071 RepID=G9MUB4_HYPVG|nr:uncharacterized protein TRIVIDRAFT_222581 [Trichoderma virens Gv29-8]EHK21964.1 hypothetical protein TRIVIDRAFT_222581 [Trichoderma virens Gv29-8]